MVTPATQHHRKSLQKAGKKIVWKFHACAILALLSFFYKAMRTVFPGSTFVINAQGEVSFKQYNEGGPKNNPSIKVHPGL